MSHRWISTLTATTALLLAGCGSDDVAITTPTEQSGGQGASLDAKACVEVTQANLDLAVADTAEEAKTAADVLGKFHPPADVQESVDHFVETGGMQFDDPDFDEFNNRIDAWVKQVCPL